MEELVDVVFGYDGFEIVIPRILWENPDDESIVLEKGRKVLSEKRLPTEYDYTRVR